MPTTAFFIALQIMSELSLRKIYILLPRHIQPGGKFDQFNILLSGLFCGLRKNESVSDPLASPFSCHKEILSGDFLSKEICTSHLLINCK